MKKLLAILMASLMVLTVLAGCSAEKAEYKLGVGTVVSYDEKQSGSASCEVTVAAVVLDKDGKIVDCKIDTAAPNVTVADGFVQDGADTLTFKTKYDLGNDYNMVAYGNAIKEWFEQADAFAAFVKGKTVSEVAAIAMDADGKSTDADLTASCTIEITDFVKAVEVACKDEQARTYSAEDVKLGLQVDAAVETSNDSEDNNGKVEYIVTASAVVVDKDGKLAAAVVDAAQPSFAFDDAGEVTAVTYNGTKRELKDNYGMVQYAGAKAEWYAQSAAMCEAAAGKTADEVKALAGADGKAADADLAANCTIAISGDLVQIVAAMSKAK